MATNDAKAEYIPHANVPGPPRLEMERADNSGTVNPDPMFVCFQ
jgi:hypothetical protein